MLGGDAMTPIPQEAMPVVEEIRRLVPRPEILPRIITSALRWDGSGEFEGGFCCPMGLLPSARVSLPFLEGEVDNLDFVKIEAFAHWWDSHGAEDAQAAVDAVWGLR